MNEEKVQVLKMLESGKISANQAGELLKAMEDVKPSAQKKNDKWIRIKVTDPDSDNTKVNVNIPLSLLDMGLKIAQKFASDSLPQDLDINQIADAIKNGVEGKIVDVQNEKGMTVEIIVE